MESLPAPVSIVRESLSVSGVAPLPSDTTSLPPPVLMSKLAQKEEVVRRIQTFPDPHKQAVLLARLRIATEATDVQW